VLAFKTSRNIKLQEMFQQNLFSYDLLFLSISHLTTSAAKKDNIVMEVITVIRSNI